MQQVRFFKGVETQLSELQNEINAWLKNSKIKVINIFGNIAPQTTKPNAPGDRQFNASDVLVTVVYEA